MKHGKLRTVATHTGLALGVIVGGVIVGATVVAPAVSRTKPLIQRTLALAEVTAPIGTAEIVGKLTVMKDQALVMAGSVPKPVWIGVDAALLLAFSAAWAGRRRRINRSAPANISVGVSTKRAAAVSPAKLGGGKSGRTPRTVLALAESGTTPADIARRTGLSLDAVAMCLSMGSFAARQLQPPTA